MYLIYFDEAKPDAEHPHYHIGGVAIESENLASIESEISAISKRCFGEAGLSRSTEIHAAEIYHRKKLFKEWNDFEERIQVLKDILPILSRPDVKLIDIQVNPDKLYVGQDESEIAFMFLCERANGLVRGNRSVGMLIGDRESDRVSEAYAETLSGYRERGTEFMFGREIQHLVDSVHFTHSHLSRFLQLADVYTWFCQFRLRHRKSQDKRHRMVLDALRSDEVDLFPATYKEWPK